MSDSLRRLGDAMQIWLEHQTAPRGSDAELLQQHPELRDLLEPLCAAGPALAAERRYGEFRIEREIGRGGMGVVYAAVQESLGRRVALKVLGCAGTAGSQAIARFRRESELLARLRHDHLVPVFEAGMADGVPWFAMELVDGCSLADVTRQLRARVKGPCDGSALAFAHAAALDITTATARLRAASHTAAVVQCLLPIGEALAYMHGHRILHRDIKPANILLRRDGVPLLGDFGLARDLRDPALTQAGNFAGTPHYVSPEQAAGQHHAVDERADVFALGVVCYELLLLQRPFDGDTSEAVLHCVQHQEPPALVGRAAGLSAEVAAVLEKALQKRPEDRYAGMADFVADLRCLLELRPVSARRSGPVTRLVRSVRRQPGRAALLTVGVASLIAVCSLSAYLWWQQPRITAATQAELLPRVEALLQDALLAQHAADPAAAAAKLDAAYQLLPDLPEVCVERLRLQRREGTVASEHPPGAWSAADAAIVDQATLPLPASEPTAALGWFVRGSTALDAFARDGDAANLQLATSSLRRAIDRAAAPRAIYHCQLLRAVSLAGDHEATLELVGAVQHLWPDSPYAGYWCGVALWSLDPDRARADVDRLLARHPQHVHLQALQAQMLVESAPTEAVQHADFAIAARPDWIAPRTIKARALVEAKLPDAALAVCDEAIALDPQSGMAQATRGRVLGHLGRLDEALAACDRGVQLAPSAVLPHIHRAYVLDRQGKLDLALAAASAADACEPRNPFATQALALAQLRAGQHAAAEATFERLVAMSPKHYAAWLDLGNARKRSGKFDAAEAAFRESLRVRPDYHLAHLQLGLQAARRKDLASAEDCFRAAIRGAPADGEGRLRLAALLFNRGEFAEGQTLCAEARACAPGINEGYTLAVRGHLAARQPAAAIALQIEFCAQRPRQVDARLALCELLLRDPPATSDFAPAEAALAEAERLEPGRGDVAFWRGELALRQGQPEAAKAAFARAADHSGTPEPLRVSARERLTELSR